MAGESHNGIYEEGDDKQVQISREWLQLGKQYKSTQGTPKVVVIFFKLGSRYMFIIVL